MLAERADRIALVRIGIGIAGSDDNRPEAAVVESAGGQHRRSERGPIHVAQGQKQRHLALDVRLQADLLLEIDLRDRWKALRSLVLLFADVYLEGLANCLG